MSIIRQRSDIADQIKTYSINKSTGPAMMLVHGVGMNANYWGNLFDDLAEHFALTTIDLPGHGQSPVISKDAPTLADYTDIIAASISHSTIVVGHSMGALVALDLAVRYQKKVSGIAVLNGIYRRGDASIKAIQQRVAELSNNNTGDATATLARWFGETPTGVAAQAKHDCQQWLEQVNPTGYANAYTAFANSEAPTDADLKTIQCPTLFMTGSQEPNSTPDMSKAMHNLVTGSKCCIVKDAKHMMSLTHKKAVSDAIIQFFGNHTNA